MGTIFRTVKRVTLNILNIIFWTIAILIFTPFMNLLYTKIPFPKPKPPILAPAPAPPPPLTEEELKTLEWIKEEAVERERQIEIQLQRELDLLESEGLLD